jgi:hypothetical protein
MGRPLSSGILDAIPRWIGGNLGNDAKAVAAAGKYLDGSLQFGL